MSSPTHVIFPSTTSRPSLSFLLCIRHNGRQQQTKTLAWVQWLWRATPVLFLRRANSTTFLLISQRSISSIVRLEYLFPPAAFPLGVSQSTCRDDTPGHFQKAGKCRSGAFKSREVPQGERRSWIRRSMVPKPGAFAQGSQLIGPCQSRQEPDGSLLQEIPPFGLRIRKASLIADDVPWCGEQAAVCRIVHPAWGGGCTASGILPL